MAKPTRQDLADLVLDRYGQTFASELRIHVELNTPTALFQLLCFAMLSSARIAHDVAAEATRTLRRRGWTTPRSMAGASRDDRVAALNEAGYARYQERTATMLGDAARRLLEEHRGSLRQLRGQAGRDADQERRSLKRLKGIGDVGVDIFFREVQVAWEEVYPFVDGKAAEAARRLGLPGDAQSLQALAGNRRDLARLAAGLVRLDFADAYDEVRQAAS